MGRLRYNGSSLFTKGAVKRGYIYRSIGLRSFSVFHSDSWLQRGQNLEPVRSIQGKKQAAYCGDLLFLFSCYFLFSFFSAFFASISAFISFALLSAVSTPHLAAFSFRFASFSCFFASFAAFFSAFAAFFATFAS